MTQRRCFECDTTENLHEHHVVPRLYGGTRTIPLCGECHAKVHQSRNLTNIRVLTKAAMQHKKAIGETTGTAPYGYRVSADGVHLESNPDELAIMTMAQQLRAEGLSLRAISARLTAAGLTPRSGKAWHPQTVWRISSSKQVNT